MNEPKWKTILNWGAVCTFFLLPLSLFVLQFTIFPDLAQQKADLDYLKAFMTNITLLVFGLAGLRTWETIKANGRPNKLPPLKQVHNDPQSLEEKI